MSNRAIFAAILAGVLLLALAAGWQLAPTARRARQSAYDRAAAATARKQAERVARAKPVYRLALALDRLASATPRDKEAAWQRYLDKFESTGHEAVTARERVAHRRSARLPAAAEAKLPPGFGSAFMLPTSAKDQHGNPVAQRNGASVEPGTRRAYEVWLRAPRMEFVLIPAGEFLMGSPQTEDGRGDNEGPMHGARITHAFYLAKYELTQLQYDALTGGNPSMYKGSTRPVEQMSWEDAASCCTTLSDWSDADVRLPTEAEWEYACRAGTVTRFSCGADPGYSRLREHAWYGADGDQTRPVGRKKPNPWGLYDMHGNVWEWCLDGEREYTSAPQTDPRGPEEGCRVVRGGAWSLHPRRARSAFRIAIDPTRPCHLVGFRMVCSPKGSRGQQNTGLATEVAEPVDP